MTRNTVKNYHLQIYIAILVRVVVVVGLSIDDLE